MQPEGWDVCLLLIKWRRAVPRTLREPMETPLGTNPLHPNVIRTNPAAARLYEEDALRMGKKEQALHVGTTYRLTEHFHYPTKHALL